MLTLDWLRDFKLQGNGRMVRRNARLPKRATHADRSEFVGLRTVQLLEDRALLSWLAAGPTSVMNGQVEGITNRPVSGALHTVAAHPTNADVLYIGSVNGGIWKTTDATAASPTWTPQTDNQESLSIGTIEFDPTDATGNTLVAGMARFSSFARVGGPRSGLLRTTDGGANWTPLDGGGVLDGMNIVGVAARGATIVLAVDTSDSGAITSRGIFRSTNSGASFTQIGLVQGIPRGVNWDLASDPTNNAVLYTAVTSAEVGGSGVGIYKSSDTGATWTKVSNTTMDALVGGTTNNIEFAVGRANNVFASIVNNGRLAGLFRSGNGGGSWTQLDTPTTVEGGVTYGLQPSQHPGSQGGLHFSMAADPSNPNVLYLGGDRQPGNGDSGASFPNTIGANDYSGRLFRVDAAASVGSQAVHLTHSNVLGAAGGGTANRSAPHADSRDLAFDANGRLVEVDDGGVYFRSSPATNTGDWFSLNGNLQITEMHDVAYDSLSNTITSGNQDTGTTFQTGPGVTTFNSLSTGDGGDVSIDNITLAGANQSIRYTSFQNLGGFRRTIWDASGSTVSTAFPVLTVIGGGAAFSPQFRTPVELNAVSPQRLVIVGSNSVYESFNQGDSIAEVNDGGSSFGFNPDVSAIAYGHSANVDVIYAGQGSSVLFRTTVGAALAATPVAFPGGTVRELALDSTSASANVVFVIDDNQVFVTTSAGAGWSDITGNLAALGAIDFRTMTFVPGAGENAIVLGTQTGVYYSESTAYGSWSELSTGLPNVLVYDMDYDASDDVLVAGTLGRGAWTLPNVSIELNDLPTISDISNLTVNENGTTGPLSFTIGDVETATTSLALSAGSSDTTLVPIGNIVFGGSGANRTVTVTPTAGLFGTATISVTVTDALGGTATDTFLLTVNAKPRVTITVADTALRIGETSLVTFTFTEAVTGFDAADVTVENGTLSGLAVTADPLVYTATLTPNAGVEDTTNLVSVGTGYTDLVGASGYAATSNNYAIDTISPTVVVNIVDASLTDADISSVVTFLFSEPVTGFDAADITLSGGTLSGFSGSGSTYSATFTVADDVELTGSVSVGTGYLDAAGNSGAAGSDTVAVDTRNATVVVDLVDTLLNDSDSSSIVSFTFSEPVTGFNALDLTLVGGIIGSFSGFGSNYMAIFMATNGIETLGSVTVGTTGYFDAGGNIGAGGADTIAIDTRNPSVVVNIVDATLNVTDLDSLVTFSFNEAVTGFDETDITLTGGTLSGFTGSGNSYSATFTLTNGSTSGSVSVGTAYIDAVGNVGIAGSDSVSIDTVGPTVVVDIVDASLSDTDSTSFVTFVFSESVTGFDLSDVTFSGGTLSSFTGSGSTYYVSFRATDGIEATGSVSVGTAYTDLAANVGVGSSDSVAIDTLNPTLTVDLVETLLSDPLSNSSVSFEFSEAVTGFDESDITVSGGVLSGFSGSGSSSSYSATFTADDGVETTGSVAVGIGYVDAVGNVGGTGSDSVLIDTLNPTMTVNIVDTALNDSDPSSSVTFEFSEAVTGFDESDITLDGGTLSGFSGSGSSYSATFTVQTGFSSGAATVGTDYSDLAGNIGAGGTDSVAIDTANPTVTVNIVNDSLSDADLSSLVTFDFSEPVTGFNAADVTLSGGTLSGFSGSGSSSSYSATFTATNGIEETGSVTVGTGYIDASGNVGEVGSDTVTIDTLNATVTVDLAETLLSDSTNSSLVTFEFSEPVTDFDESDLTVFGGTISGFGGSGSSYSATFTADDGIATTGYVLVGASYLDATGNVGGSGSDTVTIDTLNPSVTVNIVDLALRDSDLTSLVTFVFSESVVGFDESDITLTGGTLSNFSVSGASYSATFTADTGVDTGSVDVGTDYTDAVGNVGAGGSDSVAIDTLNPTVTVDIVDDLLSDPDNSSLVTFEFSEPVTNFDASDVTVTRGVLSGFSGSGSSYSATFTANDSLEVTGSVTVGTGYIDASGNVGETGADSVTIDTFNPAVLVNIVATSLSDTTNSSTVTFEFSEDVADFDESDITLVGGTLSGFGGSGASYSATFTATNGAALTGSVTVGTGYTDIAGNVGATSADTVTIDTLNPTIVVNIVDTSMRDADFVSLVTFSFSSPVEGFDASDLSVVGGTLSGFGGSGSTYFVSFTADDDATLTGSVSAAATYTDLVGNAGTAGADTVAIDTRNPTLTVNIVDVSLSDADNRSQVTFVFSEPVLGFASNDLVLVGGTISGFSGSGSSYSATFTVPNSSTTGGSVTVAGTSYTDIAGNVGAGAADFIDVDTLNPSVVVNIVDTSLNDADNSSVVTFVFSEEVANFDASDLTIVGGTLSGFSGSNRDYSATFTANDNVAQSGSVTVATTYSDLAGNIGGSRFDTVAIDTQNPTVIVNIVDVSLSDADNSSLVTFAFSSAPTGFALSDVAAEGGTLSSFAGSGSSYSARFTATNGVAATGSVTVGTGYFDTTGNAGSTGSDTVVIDTLNASVIVNVVDDLLSDTDNSSDVTFEFSEPVTGFTAADVALLGGTLSGFSGSGTSYSAIFTAANGASTIGTVTVGTGYLDGVGNAGTSGVGTVEIDTLNPSVTVNFEDALLNDGDLSSVVTFVFTSDVLGFDESDVTVAGGTLTDFSGSGDSFSATFTAQDGTTEAGTVSVGTDYTDAAGNVGTAGSDSLLIDTLNPTVSVNIVDTVLRNADLSSVVTFSFSSAVTGFTIADINVEGGTLTGFSGVGSTYSATFLVGDGQSQTGSVSVGTGYTNAAENVGTGGSDTVLIDTLSPSVTVAFVTPLLSDPANSSLVNFEFSEPVSGFTASDLTTTNGTLTGFSGSGSSYSATFIAIDGANTSGSVTVGAIYTDLVGNAGTTGSGSVAIDTLNPTVTVNVVDVSLNLGHESSSVTFTFSEPVTGFDADDVTLVGGTLTDFSGSGSSYSATFTAENGIEATGSVSVGTDYTDAAGNVGTSGSDSVEINTTETGFAGVDVTITLTGGQSVVVQTSGGNLQVLIDNVIDPDFSAIPAPAVQRLTINGGAGNNLIDLRPVTAVAFARAGGVAVTVEALAGNDFVLGSEFNDLLFGGDGDDSIEGGAGTDFLDGGIGNDVISGGFGADSLLGGTGTDTLRESADLDITLTSNLLVLSLSGLNATTDGHLGFEAAILTGGPSANRIDASSFVVGTGLGVTLIGAAGNDILTSGIGRDSLAGDDGDDSINAGSGNDIVLAGAGRDTVNGSAGADSISGGDGIDAVFGGTGNDTIDGGLGNDVLNGQDNDDLIFGGGDNDKLTGATGNDSLDGGLGNDTLGGDAGNDVLAGRDGLDLLTGGDGNDRLEGEAGNDSLRGEAGFDVLLGGAGSDNISGGSENDSLDGGDDNDSLFGDFGDDTVLGGAGDDQLRGHAGQDSIDGGAGTGDKLSEEGDTNFLITGTRIVSVLYGDETPTNIERFNLSGGIGNNLIDGRLATVKLLLNGLGGNDTLLGGAFIDNIFGGDGDDVLSGGASNDVIDGGAGADFFYEKVNANVTITGLQVVSTGTGNETLVNIDRIALVGGDGANVLGAGSSSVPVILLGGKGNDILIGSNFNDVLIGGNRADSAAGTDSLTGGSGADTFDNDPADMRVTDASDSVIANVFASPFPSWLDLI